MTDFTPTPEAVEAVAKAAHEKYESAAPAYDYDTKPESRVLWRELPENHRALMESSARAAIAAFVEAEGPRWEAADFVVTEGYATRDRLVGPWRERD